MSFSLLSARWAAPAVAALLAACAASRHEIAPPPPTPPPLDASYDWHVLLVAPFGSVLKDVPMTLHEVLLFRDEARSASPADDPECYAANGMAPRFIARSPALYLLCFSHGRLSRVEAMVRLPENQAAQIFAAACAMWMKNTQAPNSEGCSGADDSIVFAARVEKAPDEADTQLTMQLDASDLASEHAADRAPDRQP
jgi:hypothetical protein